MTLEQKREIAEHTRNTMIGFYVEYFSNMERWIEVVKQSKMLSEATKEERIYALKKAMELFKQTYKHASQRKLEV
jgi:hypothetical protein